VLTTLILPHFTVALSMTAPADFGRLRFRLRAIKQITAATSSSAESAISAMLLSNKMLSCVTQMLANKLLLANKC